MTYKRPFNQDGVPGAPAVNRDRHRGGRRAGVGFGDGGDGGCEAAARAGAERLLVVDIDTATRAGGAVARRDLTDAARRSRGADLPGGTGAVADRGAVRARRLTDAARGGGDAGRSGGGGAGTDGGRGGRARQQKKEAGRGGDGGERGRGA